MASFTRFVLNFDADTQGEPPKIMIYDLSESPFPECVGEIFLEPVPLVKNPDSFEDGHWDFPDLAKKMVEAMNQIEN